ncbi:MAG: hypothetical protein EXQ53_00755 [Acidobacteria bacterium]|nr:hypothetical protein [Acidobacteriota bacterium]
MESGFSRINVVMGVRMVAEYYNILMAGRECYHCKQWVDEGQDHDCWTTTEAELTADLSEDLREAWERLRQALAELGEQRIYASGACIMFARETVYCFVRPKRSFLEVSVFLGRALKSAQVKRVETRSKTKVANVLKITHRDAVEPPVTDWFREAYEHEGKAAIKRKATAASKKRAQKKSRPRVSRKFL